MQAAQNDVFFEQVKSYPAWKSTTYLVLGGLALYYGADFLINGAISVAREWGVTERVISITVIAIGTSVPELAASIIAALRKEESLAIGNILGSNIFNVLAVLGITSLVTDLPIERCKNRYKRYLDHVRLCLITLPLLCACIVKELSID